MSEAQQETTPAKRAKEKIKVTREIDFSLGDHEIVEKAQAAAELRLVSASLEAEFTRVKSTYKGRLEEKKNQISALLDIIREGKEKRIAEVTDVYDYEHALVETHYEDRVVEQRVMTAEERQIGLFPGVDHRKAKKAAQGELPLRETPAAQAKADDNMADLPPIQLPDPKHNHQEETVINDHDKNQLVEFHGKSWLLEPHEMSLFVVAEEDVFGQNVLVWTQKSSNKLGPAITPNETAPQ